MGGHGRWLPTGESILYAIVACLFTVLVLGSIDPTGQLRHSFLGTVQGPGVTLDEGFNVDVGTRLADSVLTGDLAGYARRTGDLPDHPPLGRLWLGLAHEIALLFVSVERVESPYVIGFARTGSAVAFGITLFLIGRIASRLARETSLLASEEAFPAWWLGLTAMLVYGTMPRQFAHAHIASLETCVALSWVAVLAWCVRHDDQLDTPRKAAGTGFWLGLAWLTKVQGILLVPPLVVWFLVRSGRRGILLMGISLSVAAATFFVGWPWLWSDPVGRTLAYLGRSTNRSPTLVWYGGQVFEDRAVPWHFPWTTLAVSLPVVTGLFSLVGLTLFLVRAFRSGGEGGTAVPLARRASLVGLISAFLVPLCLFSLPGIAVYDGERLFSMIHVVTAVLAAFGVAFVAHWCAARRTPIVRAQAAAMAFLVFCVVFGGTMGVTATWPCSLTAYGSLTGGLQGAARSGWARTYWGDSICRELLEQVPRHVPAGATLEILPVMHPFQIAVLGSQTPVLIQGEYRLVPFKTSTADGPRYLLVFFRDDYLEPEFRTAVPPGRPLSEVRRNGVLLAGLYELPPRGNLPSQ